MAEQKITCTNCGKEMLLSEALSHDLEEQIKAKYEGKVKQLSSEKDTLIKQTEAKYSGQLNELRATLEAKDDEIVQKLHDERKKVEAKYEKLAEEKYQMEFADLKTQLELKSKKLSEAQTNELQLIQKSRELEERQKMIELEVQRKIMTETEKIKGETIALLESEHKLKDAEKDKKLNDMTKQIEELRRKAEQGSQQTQGEVLELMIEDLLKTEFPLDDVSPIGKGVRGGDVLQTVKMQTGMECGIILWEFKRTKAWSDSWIQKLKENQRDSKADIAVLVSETLPKDVRHFKQIDGVWVANVQMVSCLAFALRTILSQVSREKGIQAGKKEKAELIYDYLTGKEFRGRVEAIVEAFQLMSEDLISERKALTRLWSRRENQIRCVLENTVGLYGDLQGLAGRAIPTIQVLELPLITESSEETVNE